MPQEAQGGDICVTCFLGGEEEGEFRLGRRRRLIVRDQVLWSLGC